MLDVGVIVQPDTNNYVTTADVYATQITKR
jgi:hypothetical protein